MLDPLNYKQPLQLDIGAGTRETDARFTTVDAYTDAHIKAFMWNVPLPDGSVDTIFSSQALEHVSKFHVIPTIREFHRLLKVGGKLQLLVPDLIWAINFWLTRKNLPDATGWPMDIIYGNQQHDGEYHKTGFTRKILLDYLNVSNPGEWFVHKLDFMEGSGVDNGDTVVQRVINLEAEKIEWNL